MKQPFAVLDPRSIAPLEETLLLAGGISDSTRRRIPDFPKPIVLSRTKTGRPARIAFVRGEVLEWVAARIASDRATGPETA